MRFQFDLEKSAANLAKHGIDFHRAQALWDDPNLVEVPARPDDERRALVIALLDGQHWSAVITYRGNETRIISVRRSRKREVQLYES
jgi:uncharacterized DUF497 family protein